jgi:pyruvate/2-oxoglutarate dehydrogenase complex dihydrolipoamide dehydrogenase (E3) component
MSKESFDAIIIGAGQAGGPLAGAFAKAGKRTAIVEGKHVGGTCINEGCTPTKTMVASGRVAYLAKRAVDYGVSTGNISVDMLKVRDRKREIVKSFRSGSEKRLRSDEHIDLIEGWGSFTGPKTVSVALNSGGERTLEAPLIFINTGVRSSLPPISGMNDVPTLDNVSIMELDSVPEHLLVLGGGYIGLEFAQMFRRFGSEVTIVHNGPQLLTKEDPDIAEEVAKILREDGIEIHLNAETTQASGKPGAIQLQLKNGKSLNGSHLLAATGRVPNTGRLNLNAAGIEADGHGYIQVNDRLETNVEGIYALGDVKGGPAFTHISYDDYRVIASNLLQKGSRTTRDRMLPYTVFIDPQLGRIGLTETEARSQGRKIRIARMPMTYVARALETAESRGVMKIIVDANSEQILGAAILGIEGGEIASAIQLAMMGGLKFTVLRDAVFSHPTLAESLNNVFFQWEDNS